MKAVNAIYNNLIHQGSYGVDLMYGLAQPTPLERCFFTTVFSYHSRRTSNPDEKSNNDTYSFCVCAQV
jgi:hypothetical protein